MATPSESEPRRTRVWSLPWKVLTGALVVSILVPLSWVQSGPALCPLRRYAGLPCPGCGGTRAFACMGHGEWSMAFDHHPFAALLWVMTALVAAASLLRARWPDALRRLAPGARVSRWGMLVFFGGWLAWGITRLVVAMAG